MKLVWSDLVAHGCFDNPHMQAHGRLRRFLKKNFLIQAVDAGLITMSYLGN